MAKRILILLAFFVIASSKNKSFPKVFTYGFEINGQLKGLKNATTLVLMKKNTNSNYDTISIVKSKGDKFQFSNFLAENGEVHLIRLITNSSDYAWMYDSINVERNVLPSIELFLEKGTMLVSGDLDCLLKYRSIDCLMVYGSQSHTDWLNYSHELHKEVKKEDSLRIIAINKYQKDSNQQVQDNALLDIFQMREKFIKKWVLFNPSSLFTPYLILNSKLTLEFKKNAYDQLSKNVKSSKNGRELHKYIKNIEASVIGQKAVNFNLISSRGTNLSLSKVAKEKKVILLDFWASWCKPCRSAFQNLKGIYQTYAKRGFEIISISEDKSVASWSNAIDIEGLPWLNVLQEKSLKLNKDYNIIKLPTVYVLDSQCSILAKDPTEDELIALLESRCIK